MKSVAAALVEARAAGVSALDAQLLLAHLLGCARTRLIARDERLLSAAEDAAWAGRLGRRAAGEPVAYVIGEKEFHGLAFEVNPDVLVPRPETELLVEWAAALLAPAPVAPALADLGTGSGAIAIALKAMRPDASVTATDASAQALAVARRNALRHRADIAFVGGSWWSPLAGRRFDVVVSNPPYVAGDDPHLVALHHEPLPALTPGGDGLGALDTIISGAPEHLLPGGWLLLEHGFDQAAAVSARFAATGFADIETRHDIAGLPRATGARWR